MASNVEVRGLPFLNFLRKYVPSLSETQKAKRTVSAPTQSGPSFYERQWWGSKAERMRELRSMTGKDIMSEASEFFEGPFTESISVIRYELEKLALSTKPIERALTEQYLEDHPNPFNKKRK